MRRHLPRLLALGALLSPATLYALGLGEIRLHSALNQPFDADIELIAPTRDELADLRVTLASNEMFARYGIDRPAFLSDFDFAVGRGRDGQVVIRVSSDRSITEPFVTLLVEANWGRGRLLREYTVLLDPPVFMPSQPETTAPVTAPQAGARTEGRIERVPAPAEPTQPVPAPEAVTQEQAGEPAAPAAIGGTYQVQRNDTLSRIARDVNPGASAGAINQTMIALFQANPEAFAGNINRLRAGSVLRIPELAEIESISRAEASAEVVRQQAEWSSAFRAPGEDEANRLRLVTPAETPAETPVAAATAPAPAAEPAPAAAGPASGTAPATDDKRLEVTSPGLAGVQQNVAETPPAAQPEVQAEAPVAQEPAAEPTPPAAEPAETPAAAKPRPQPAEAPPAPSLLDRIGDFWWVPVVVGVLLVLLLILTFLKRKRESASAAELDAFSPGLGLEPRVSSSLGTTSRKRADAFTMPEETEDEQPFADFEDHDEPAPVTSVRTHETAPVGGIEPKPIDETLSSETAVRFDQQDALAEADFHMAYGLYDQAADLVKIAIDREPSRRDLKLKLLEIYFVWGNRDLFLDTARDLYTTRDQAAAGEWDKVLIMGRQIAPEDSMFKGEAGAARVDLVDVNLEGGENRVDLDLFAEPEAEQSEGLDLEFASGEHKAQAESSSSSDLDFLLDEPQLGSDDDSTREIDPLARTQETPTIESPVLDRSSQTLREKVDVQTFGKTAEQTAELSLDDLGLDVDSLETTGALEQTAALERNLQSADDTGASVALRDDEMTQLAPSLGSLDRTIESPRIEKFDVESTGTIYIDQVDLSGGDTVEQPRIDIDSTAAMKPRTAAVDVDLGNLGGGARGGDTMRQPKAAIDSFSDDVFADRTSEFPKVDLDVGDALITDDHAPTNKQVITAEMELSELEPVTMSEVGTKLDLARAYMDMGDPDGARSILEEVLQEGTSNQKQEAQRLLDSVR